MTHAKMTQKDGANDLPEDGGRFFFRQIDELVPYVRNARTHSPTQVDQIVASMVEFGFTNPVLADADGIVAGHGRVLGAEVLYAMGKTIRLPGGQVLPVGTVPVIDCSGWSPAQRRAYIIADNQIALNAGWNEDILALELRDLKTAEFDLQVLGFGSDQLLALLDDGSKGPREPDYAPPIEPDPITRDGECWILGGHRLVCGDCTVEKAVAMALNGVKPHLMVTDPPYGVEYSPGWRSAVNKDGPASKRALGKVKNDDRIDWTEAWALFHGDVAYCWHAGRHASSVQASLEAAGFSIRCQIIWAKSQIAFGRGDYHWQHEPCWYAVRKSAVGHWAGDRKQTTLWQIDKPKSSETGHGTQKPVECMKRPIENNSNPGHAVYEPFSGSGTTIIACEMTGRFCHAIELSPNYVDVAVRRWQGFTGNAARLDGDGRTFDAIAAERKRE